jgi:hypothetical protein
MKKKKSIREPSSPTSEVADRLPSPERERRHALEYEEEEAPQEIAVEVKEAEVSFPNIPVPKSSDGDVSAETQIKPEVSSNVTNRIGSSECPIMCEWIQNHFIQTLTSALNTRMKKSYRLKTSARRV